MVMLCSASWILNSCLVHTFALLIVRKDIQDNPKTDSKKYKFFDDLAGIAKQVCVD